MAIDPHWVRENPEEAARQIELLTIERDQYRAAEEAQIAQREKIQERVEELECQVEEAGRYLRCTASRDLLQHAEALEEAAKESVPAMHKMANWLIARAAEKRCQAEGVE